MVWLNQLSEKYHKPIQRLNQIPNEELEWLSALGFNGLWLVGVWERSPASQKIKHLYGNSDLIASAYSIHSYSIAGEIGGDSALKQLKKSAGNYGIELACDMVPNHTALDSPWLLEHPEWYISTEVNPKNEWRFDSPNLISGNHTEICLEQGYYTQTGAAEVFSYKNTEKPKQLFIYHGNDGTSMPWNDTAQLNYLLPEVREAVKRQIIDISRLFRIIRLDAAMTLIRRHFRRLWFPQVGEPKCVPTREAFSLTQKEFDRLMPREFWVEVMEEIHASSPDTLLLAEAFWLMERYFIEELGIHRVYNSAFMHQLHDEKNAAFRQYFLNILNQNPAHLEKFINYLTTPDEKSAAELFGKSEKYFGACGLMVCLPGMPMFGHGQVEGFTEQYSMDVCKPYLKEHPHSEFIQGHIHRIVPLLQQRDRFSSAENLVLMDFQSESHQTDENVIAFMNVIHRKPSLILFNNQKKHTSGYISRACNLTSDRMAELNPFLHFLEAARLIKDGAFSLVLKDIQNHSTHEIPLEEIRAHGLRFSLTPYEFHAYDLAIK